MPSKKKDIVPRGYNSYTSNTDSAHSHRSSRQWEHESRHDRHPLNPAGTQNLYGSTPPTPRLQLIKATGKWGPLSVLAIVLICTFFIGFFIQPYFESSSQQHNRVKWNIEERVHVLEMNKWELWVRNMTMEKDKWIEDERVWLAGRTARDAERTQWALDQEDYIRWAKNVTRIHAEWDVEQNEHDIWRREVRYVKERWEREQREHRAKERQEQEERERKEQRDRDGMEWRDVRKERCVRYKTREYVATLGNVAAGLNAIDECYKKTMHINGQDLTPVRCDDQGLCGRVTARFENDYNEPGCTPFFYAIYDKGCTGGTRRYDGKLENIVEWDTWRTVCSTMSASYGSLYLGPGASCSECNGGKCGHWATWFVDDERCQVGRNAVDEDVEA